MKQVIKKLKVIEKFLEKYGLDEKTKFLLENTGKNLINLEKEVLEKKVPFDQEQQTKVDDLSQINHSKINKS